ncbi:MAG: ParB/RepB/Spo0J family partition protein [Eubacterium sp.]|nr:ParB/RepB/Spo0J family partition protein [Eubacterium sp.]
MKEKEMAVQKPKSAIIKTEDLVPFENHPYKVIDNEDMNDLIDSIREHGILNPLIVRPAEGNDGKYEIISGHRRFHAAEKLEMKKLPCTVHFIDRDAATVMMVDSNCQRTEVLPSEKAWAYRMKMDAIKRIPGRKPAENVSPVETQMRSSEIIAQESGESRAQIDRYIRLTYLVPELLQFVDEGKIKMRPAVELSYLDEEIQRDIMDCIDERGSEVFPSHAQTRRIREQAENGGITYEEIAAIMDELKPNQAEKVKIPTNELKKRIGKSMTDADAIDFIFKAVDFYVRHLQKQREQAR